MKRIIPAIILAFWTLNSGTMLRAQDTAPAISVVPAKAVAASSVKATGRVQAQTSARISPRVSGHLAALGTHDEKSLDAGMPVKKGDLLFALDPTTFENDQSAAQAGLESAQASLANLKAPPRAERVEQLNLVIRELETRIAEKKLDTDRYTRLVEEKTAPVKRLEEVRTDLTALELLLKAARSRLDEATNGPTATEIVVAEARIKEVQVSVKTAKDDLRDSQVYAPFDGIITRRMKSPGDYIAANPPVEVFEIVAMNDLEIEVRVPESYFTRVQAGETTARIESPLLKETLVLRVSRVVSEIDAQRGTFVCRIAVPVEPPTGLVPGAFVSAELLLDGGHQQAIVPAESLVADAGRTYLFVARDGRMQRRQVAPGDRLTEGVVIRSGIVAGEKVVLGPADALKDGAALPATTQP